MVTQPDQIRRGRLANGQVAFVLSALAAAMSVAQGAPVPGGSLDPTTIPKYVTDLVIPGVMRKSDDPGKDYQIAVRQFKQQMLPTQGCDSNVQPPGACKGNGTNRPFRPTTVWGYGPAGDVPPRVAPVPAAESQFNHPSFTIEVERDQPVTIDWINDLVRETADGRRVYLRHLLPVDQTLHWANPGADCLDGSPRTDCRGDTSDPYRGPVPTVTHVHGAHVGPESDGYTEAWYLPEADNINCVDPSEARGNRKWVCEGTLANQINGNNTGSGKATFTYTNDQPSTTLWYHDHSLGLTRLNVYAMGAGFWLIRAPNGGDDGLVSGTLPGPAPVLGEDPNFDPEVRKTIREIPIAIQVKSFNSDGSLFYPATRSFFEGLDDGQTYGLNGNLNIPFLPSPTSDISPVWNPEAFFNVVLVNGSSWPKLDVEPERYRLRLLNATNSRFLNLAMFLVNPDGSLGDEVPFYQIGAEQSLLAKVTKVWTGCKTWLGQGQDAFDINNPPAPPASTAQGCPVTAFGNWDADDPQEALLMGPAERPDVIVDFTGMAPGAVVRMVNTAPDAPFGGFPDDPADVGTTGQVMEFHLVADDATTIDNSTPPSQLKLAIPDSAEWTQVGQEPVLTRDLALLEEESALLCVSVNAVTGEIALDPNSAPPVCGAGSFSFAPKAAVLGVNGRGGGTVQLWDDPISQAPTVGDAERWELWNWSADAHPIHIHLVKFRVMTRRTIGSGDPDDIAPGDPLGTFEGAELTESGWKDTVIAYPGEVTTVAAKFDVPGLYVWHCHILEHEDNEMMVPFCVNNEDGSPGPGCVGL